MIRILNNNGSKQLELFQGGISIDKGLPKYVKTGEQVATLVNNSGEWDNGRVFNNSFDNIINSKTYEPLKKKLSIIAKIKKWFKKDEVQEQMAKVGESFRLIIEDPNVLASVNKKREKLYEMIKEAKSNGQIALAEKLTDEAAVTVQEEMMIENGYSKVVTEERMIEFVEKFNKVLELTYIKNYIRQIPADVIALKKKADAIGLFDNYIILHIDPTQRNSEKTKKEKDPILFGLIKNSNKFYYVGSWIDELCDLTFDKFIETYGEEKLKLKTDMSEQV